VPLLVTLALRNLLRQRRRTLLTAAALVFGIAIMILGNAWQAATEKAVVEPAKLSTLGHVQVFAEDAAADEGAGISFIAPQNNYRLIPDPRGVIDTVLREEPRLVAGIARLMVGALLSSGDVSMEGLLIGIDPAARAAAYPALGLREGRFFEPGEKGIVLNRGVARKLGVGVGGTVVALGTTADGRLSGVKLTVTGVWMVRGLEAYEWGSCFADLAAVQELLDAGDAAGVIVFRQRDESPSAPVAVTVPPPSGAAASARAPTPGRRWGGRSSAA
jgi:putative ABC transport system permease protein